MSKMPELISRRGAIRSLGLIAGGAFLTACGLKDQRIEEAKLTPKNTTQPTKTPLPTNTEIPSPTPEPTPTPMGANVLDLMEKARQEGEETFSLLDPAGIEVVVDVVPQEVVEQGEWSWELRGFTREIEGQLQVWRTLKEREKDLSQWFDVVSLLDVPGYGKVTIEFDREAMAKKGLTEIYLRNPQDWQTVLDIFWGEKETAKIAEPSDYGLIHEKILKRAAVPFEWFSIERLVKNSGVSFLLVPEFDESFNKAEKWRLQTGVVTTGVAFKNTAQAGRVVLVMYFASWYDGRNLESSNLGFYGSANLDWFVNQGGSNYVVEMLREDRNPWRQLPSGKQPYRTQKAWEAIALQGSDGKWYTKLVGPHP